MNSLAYFLVQIVLLTVPILFSLTVHELCHGYSAYLFGDPTPKLARRLTLNPFRHMDIVGITLLFLTRSFGWAKPIPVYPGNFDKPKTAMLIVALAGPGSNITLALLSAASYQSLSPVLTHTYFHPMLLMLMLMIKINLSLAIFNLIPMPPLDGSHIVKCLLPDHILKKWLMFEPYAFIVVLVFIVTGLFGKAMLPVVNTLTGLLT